MMMETKARKKKKMRMEMGMASMVCRLRRSEQATWAGRLGPAGPRKLTWSPWGVGVVARSSRRTRHPWNDSFDAPSDGGPSLVFVLCNQTKYQFIFLLILICPKEENAIIIIYIYFSVVVLRCASLTWGRPGRVLRTCPRRCAWPESATSSWAAAPCPPLWPVARVPRACAACAACAAQCE
jgi:hypothetical protein